ncbi:hypothetical protein BT96DRAFT_923873 [Gymnopus androsaceus JB14]|uniref:Uncharacterized protein n=1 Tax=Gymnopus androsaceus JB14 TaxID=1447944 RepID=A0A6A4H6D5_9AGAR|nr:hypothetical protein BT96DRAFT_923873 [Gymnopus androsaceus JB14]
MEPSLHTSSLVKALISLYLPTLLSHPCFLQELLLPLFYLLMMHFNLSCSDDALVAL